MHNAKSIFKDYLNNSRIEFEKIKPGNVEFHNTVQVQLFDAKKNKLEKESITENIVNDFTGFSFLDVFHRFVDGDRWKNDASDRLFAYNNSDLFRCMVLTDDTSAEQAKFFYPLGNVIGYANRVETYSGDDKKRGTLNLSESTKNWIDAHTMQLKYVFDFPTSAANGTMKKIYWHNNLGMFNLLFTGNYFDVPNMFDTDISSGVGGLLLNCGSYFVALVGASMSSIENFTFAAIYVFDKSMNLKLKIDSYNDSNYATYKDQQCNIYAGKTILYADFGATMIKIDLSTLTVSTIAISIQANQVALSNNNYCISAVDDSTGDILIINNSPSTFNDKTLKRIDAATKQVKAETTFQTLGWANMCPDNANTSVWGLTPMSDGTWLVMLDGGNWTRLNADFSIKELNIFNYNDSWLMKRSGSNFLSGSTPSRETYAVRVDTTPKNTYGIGLQKAVANSPFAQTLLASPITKDSTKTLKIIYTFNITYPTF